MGDCKKMLRLRYDELLLYAALEVGGFALGQLLKLVMLSDKEFVNADAGSLMGIAVAYAVLVFTGGIAVSYTYHLCVGMGELRRRFLPAYITVSGCLCLLMDVLAWVLNRLELGWIRVFFHAEPENIMAPLFNWKVLLVIMLGAVGIQLLFGALIAKYGRIGFWISYACWMVACLGIPRLTEHIPGLRTLAQGDGWILIGIVLSLFFLAAGCGMLLRQEVRG